MGVNFWSTDFGGFVGSPRDFFLFFFLFFPPIRSSPSLGQELSRLESIQLLRKPRRHRKFITILNYFTQLSYDPPLKEMNHKIKCVWYFFPMLCYCQGFSAIRTTFRSYEPLRIEAFIPHPLCILWELGFDERFKNLMGISCLINFKKILIKKKLCLPLGNLVFRVSPLPVTRRGKMRHPGNEVGR